MSKNILLKNTISHNTHLALKVRIYPSQEQIITINKTLGCCRQIYNTMLFSRLKFYNENIKDKEVLNYIDVLVDGQFQIKNRNPKLKYCGSTNQRVIDVKKSLKKGEVVLFYKEVFQ